MCANRLPMTQKLALHMGHFLFGDVSAMRTHRQISAQEQTVGVSGNSTGNHGSVTLQAIHSFTNVIVLCVVSLLLNTPGFVFVIIRYVINISISGEFSFAVMLIF